jgi:hypothetical protein
MIKKLLVFFLISLASISFAQHNLAQNRIIKVSSENTNAIGSAKKMVDGQVSESSQWVSNGNNPAWIVIGLDKVSKLGGLHLYFNMPNSKPAEEFQAEFKRNGQWLPIPSANVTANKFNEVALAFDATVDVFTDSIRIVLTKTKNDNFAIKEICVWPENRLGLPPFGKDVTGYVGHPEPYVPKIYINQSGYNLGKPKRFTSPLTDNGTAFNIIEKGKSNSLFRGKILNNIGDFSDFNPESEKEYVILADTFKSFPFRIGMWWIERATYQNAINFMIDSRHYVGNYTKKCSGTYGWRDDSHFGWELHTLVPQYLSNPEAYLRMPHQVRYQVPTDTTLWGALKPYNESAPDIVKLMHWGADVIVSQKLTHEHFKGQLAYFLYAWPHIKQWLPQQNYDVVKKFAFEVWQLKTVDKPYAYNESDGHDMLALKTKIGTTKGALPPGASIIPNLMMYEVAKREKMEDMEMYFDSAYNQVKWMIEKLDWNDPITTKGQRMSEFITMTSLAYILNQYPERAPVGLKQKIADWADVVIRRSDNMWDFRKLDDKDAWCPTGTLPQHWNEVGNIVGFPAAIISMIQYIDNKDKVNRLHEIACAHLDNSFGRNPCGRHCSFDAEKEIEGVDLGWYHQHPGGIGQLENARFVLDGSPKNAHYPYHPERGDIGWTEGWVSFNVAYNLSLAYMAWIDTEFDVSGDKKWKTIRLKVPLNFDYNKTETVTVDLTNKNGEITKLILTEESKNSEYFSAKIKIRAANTAVSYGLGYFRKRVLMN